MFYFLALTDSVLIDFYYMEMSSHDILITTPIPEKLGPFVKMQ